MLFRSEIGAVRHAHHVVTLSGKVASQDLVATTRPHRILLLYGSGEEGTRTFCCDCYFVVVPSVVTAIFLYIRPAISPLSGKSRPSLIDPWLIAQLLIEHREVLEHRKELSPHL